MKHLLWLLALVSLSGAAEAQVGGEYWMRWSAAGGGAGISSNGNYFLGGLSGTPEGGSQQGGSYQLFGGFWFPANPTTVDAGGDPVPRTFVMRAPTPSPFRDRVAIAFELPEAQRVSVLVHSVDGRLVRKLMDRDYDVGRHTIHWDAKDQGGRSVASECLKDTNPLWTPHARFHVVWQVLSYAGVGLIALGLIWIRGPQEVERLYLAGGLGIAMYGALLRGYLLATGLWRPSLRRERLSAVQGADRAGRRKWDVNVTAFTIMSTILVLGLIAI